MRVLFAVQGEGRGHFTQALTLKRMLEENGHEVVGIMVGCSNSRRLPKFFVDKADTDIIRFESPNFLPAKRKANVGRSVLYNIARSHQYAASIARVKRTVDQYSPDIIVNFYELMTGLANALFRLRAPMICIAHQYYFLHGDVSVGDVNTLRMTMLKMFSYATSLCAARRLALSFAPLHDDEERRISVVPPLLRKEVLQQKPSDEGFVLGYMLNHGFQTDVETFHKQQPDVPLRFFWDKKNATEVTRLSPTLEYHTIDDRRFIDSMARCHAYATTAGFESVCEALYMQKPVLMVPVHIEQQCNAIDARNVGAGIIADGFDIGRLLDFAATYKPNKQFARWARSANSMVVEQIEKAADPQNVALSFG